MQHFCPFFVATLVCLARDAARRLHADYGRKVRIIDQNERVWLRLP